jgi:putative addiction module antidote
MSGLKIRRIGNSLGVIFPKEVQEALGVSEGDILDVNTVENKLILEAHLAHHSKWKFPNSELSNEDKEWIGADLEDGNESPLW